MLGDGESPYRQCLPGWPLGQLARDSPQPGAEFERREKARKL
jgi:hypothetical protein